MINAQPASPQAEAPLTRNRFECLASNWMNGVGPSSDPRVLVSHPAYREIVRYGRQAVPYILRDLAKAPSLLAWALFDITGENPVPSSANGNVKKITKAWLAWGRQQNLD